MTKKKKMAFDETILEEQHKDDEDEKLIWVMPKKIRKWKRKNL